MIENKTNPKTPHPLVSTFDLILCHGKSNMVVNSRHVIFFDTYYDSNNASLTQIH